MPLFRSSVALWRGGTHSADQKSIAIWWNTLCRPDIDLGNCGTHSAGRKLTQDMAEHTLPTGNRPKTWRNTLCRPEMVWFFLPNGSYARDTQAQGACALRFFIIIWINRKWLIEFPGKNASISNKQSPIVSQLNHRKTGFPFHGWCLWHTWTDCSLLKAIKENKTICFQTFN